MPPHNREELRQRSQQSIIIQRPEISNSCHDENHHALVIRNVDSQQENPADHTDSNQETPTLN
ncbi:35455_t:CDS:2, partial [Gigaspora margarita]